MPKLIAVVDDDIEMGEIYSLLLENHIKRGLIELQFFTDSLKFIHWLRNHEPDIILTDINMPLLDGPSLIKLVKRSGRSIPTYFVSGHCENEYRTIMQELGVYRFLSKPLNFNHVLALVELDLGILTANL